jgi:ribosomal protein S27AE
MEATRHFLDINWTNHLKPIEAHYYRQFTRSRATAKRLERNECPRCGTALTIDFEQIHPPFFSYEDGTIHEDVRKVQLCPACGFTKPVEVDIPF